MDPAPHQQVMEDYRTVFASSAGQRVLRDLCFRCQATNHVSPEEDWNNRNPGKPPIPIDPINMAKMAGRRETYLMIEALAKGVE